MWLPLTTKPKIRKWKSIRIVILSSQKSKYGRQEEAARKAKRKQTEGNASAIPGAQWGAKQCLVVIKFDQVQSTVLQMTWTDQQLNAVATANPTQKFNSPATHVPTFGILSSLWCMSWRYQITPYCAVYIFLNPSQKALKVRWTQSAPSPICHQLDCPIGVTQH